MTSKSAGKASSKCSRIARSILRLTSKCTSLFSKIHIKIISASLEECGKGLRATPSKLKIICPSNIRIGSNFIASGDLLLNGYDGEITIGNNCSFNNNVQIGASGGKVSIGSDVLIAFNVVIRAADHIYIDPEKLIREQGHRGGDITIEDDVWICSNTVITKGCTIGKGAVIAAGSVITKSVEPFTVVGGIPARELKKRGKHAFPEETFPT